MGGQRELEKTDERTDVQKKDGCTPEQILERGMKDALRLSRQSSPELICNMDGSIKSIFSNYCDIITQDHFMRDKLFFNLLENNVHVSNVFWDMEDHALSGKDILYFRKIINLRHGIDNEKAIISAMTYNAHLHEVNPLEQKLKSLKWDGTPRIHRLFPKYLGAEESEYTTAVTKMVLYGAIQRILQPGVKFDNCAILADRKQGSGKSTICRFLALDDNFFVDDLDDMGDGDKAYRKIRTAWIVELAEMLATRNSKTIETIKAFLSRKSDSYTEKYEVITEKIPRHCIFIGTTNKPEFLPYDPTGNRRFYPVLCDAKKAEIHPLANEAETRAYIEQCYAEAMVTGAEEGWPLEIDHKFDDELERQREASMPDDTRIPIIQEWLDGLSSDYPGVCSRMIYYECLNDDTNKHTSTTKPPEKWELQEISDIMNLNIKGWMKYRSPTGDDRKKIRGSRGSYGVQRAWVRKPHNITAEAIQAWLDEHTEINIICIEMLFDLIFDSKREPCEWELNLIRRIISEKLKGWKTYTKDKDAKKNEWGNHKWNFEEYGYQDAWVRVDKTVDKTVDEWLTDNGFVNLDEGKTTFDG